MDSTPEYSGSSTDGKDIDKDLIFYDPHHPEVRCVSLTNTKLLM